MTVRLRKLPTIVISLLAICVLFLCVIFVAGPLYSLATNRIATGRVVQADTRDAQVLIDNEFYTISNDCLNMGQLGPGTCLLKEGDTEWVLISSPDKEGLQLSYMLTSLAIGLGGSLIILWLCFEVRFRKPPVPRNPHPTHSPHVSHTPHQESSPSSHHQPPHHPHQDT